MLPSRQSPNRAATAIGVVAVLMLTQAAAQADEIHVLGDLPTIQRARG